MTLFHYRAVGAAGRQMSGDIDAPSLAAAIELLRQRGLAPYHAVPANGRSTQSESQLFRRGAVGLEWRAAISRQLATLLAAGITLDRALTILGTQANKPQQRAILQTALAAVSGGAPLSAALSRTTAGFRPHEIGLIQAGEQSGALSQVLDDLAGLLTRQQQLRSKLISSLTYPALLMALAPITLVIIAAVLLPNLEPVFANSKAELPLILRIMRTIIASIEGHGLLWLVSTVAFASAAAVAVQRTAVKENLRHALWALPILRTIRRHAETSRICRSFASLLKGGAHLQSAILAVAAVAGDASTRTQLSNVRERVASGEKLGKALGLVKLFDKPSLQMVAIGEETNKLDTMLSFVADAHERKLNLYLDRSMAILTPLLTIVMGLMVGGIVMSIMNAILSVTDLAAT